MFSILQNCISDQIRKTEEGMQLNQAKRCLLQYIQEKIQSVPEGAVNFDIDKQWLLSPAELEKLFLINLNKVKKFNEYLADGAKAYAYIIGGNAYYSLTKILESPWAFNEIIPLTIYYPFPPLDLSKDVA